MYWLDFSSSVYCYVSNNPLQFIDVGGNFKIEVNTPKGKEGQITQLAVTRLSNIAANLGYLLELTREVTLPDGSKQEQSVLEYLMKDTGLSKLEIYNQISHASGATIEIGETAMNQPAQTPTQSKIILDVDALTALSNPDLTDDQLADLALVWGVTILHELTHLGDRLSNNGNITGQPGLPNGVQPYGRAQAPALHRGQTMELAFFGQTFYNTMEQQTDSHSGEVIHAGMGFGDLSSKKKMSGLNNEDILKESNVKSKDVIRRSYAEF
jgi:hypothetical protein